MPYTYDLKNPKSSGGSKPAAGGGGGKKNYNLMQYTQQEKSSIPSPRALSAHRAFQPLKIPHNVLNAEDLQTRNDIATNDKLDALGLPRGSMIREMSKPTQGAGTFGKLKSRFDNAMASTITGTNIGEGMNDVRGGSVADLLGSLAGFAAGSKQMPNIGSSSFELGAKALNKPTANTLIKGLPMLQKPSLAKSMISMAGGGAATEITNDISNNKQFNPGDMAKNVAANALMGAATHGLVKVAPPIINKMAEFKNTPSWGQLSETAPKVNPNQWGDIVSAYKNPVSLGNAKLSDKQALYNKLFNEINADVGPVKHTGLQQGIDQTLIKPTLAPEARTQVQSEIEGVFKPREVGSYKLQTGEQRALNDLQEGITKAQNYIGHNDIYAAYPPGTPKEAIFADIKANTNVDIPALTANLERAQSLKNKLTPDELRLGRASGVVPKLRDERLDLPTAEPPAPLPERALPNPERLTWTNKDGIPPGPRTSESISNPNSLEIPKINLKGNKVMAADIEALGVSQIDSRTGTMTSDVITPEAAATSLDVPLEDAIAPGLNLDFTKLKDIGHLKAYTKDVYRIFRDVFGQHAGDEMLLPFDKAKGAHIDMQNDLLSRLKTEIVDNLGIGKKTKESALVQRFGEKGLDADSLKLFEEGKITRDELEKINLDKLKQLAPDKWENIVKADKWFRKEYDSLVEQINQSRRSVYPNAEANAAEIEGKIESVKKSKDYSAAEKTAIIKQLETELEDVTRNKIIPKRSDYYRHFQEMTEGFKALKNIFDSPAQISTQLIGTSEFTRPKSKWASIAQKRLGNQTEHDAVGGFLNYIPAATYATHIDPQIASFRELERALKNVTADTHNVDTFIGFLDKYASHLAGKTNPVDRVFQDMVPGGRKTFTALNWLNSRIKANTVLGKAGSALAQLANIPTGLAFAKQYSLPGMARTVGSIFKENPDMAKSAFIKERFGGVGGKMFRQFDESLLNKPKEMAVWLMETADKVGTTFIWNSAYAKGLAQGAENPIRYADLATRDLVAGRGIGEVPIIQQSKLFQLVAPFQLEVGNLWHIQKDFVKTKDFAGLVALYFLNYGFNEMMKATRGSGVVFDPIGAMVDASKEKDITPAKAVGRLTGEVLSNIPMGQTVADWYPDNGMAGLPAKKQFFGRNDPTRFGSGILAVKGLQDPLFKVLPSFGGDQIKKTLDGLTDINQKAHLSGGKLAYPVAPTLPNKIKGTLFGPSAFTEAQDYYNNNRKPLSNEQTKATLRAPNISKAYQEVLKQREIDNISTEIANIKKDKTLTKTQQLIKVRALEQQQQALKRKLGR
jgi:hypothetical protein